MIIYKYVTSAGDDLIQNLRIRLTSPRNFNDPFEMLPVVIDVTPEQIEKSLLNNDKYLRHIYEQGASEGRVNKPFDVWREEMRSPSKRKDVVRNMGNLGKILRETCMKNRENCDKIALMACFCGEAIDSHHEILMWAHYAEGYKGLRIAFNSELLHSLPTPLMKIEYGEDRLQLNSVDYWEKGVQSFKDVYQKTLRAKSSAWAYENEYRWLVSLPLCKKIGQNYYAYINPKSIVGVDCGVQCSSERVSRIKDLVRKNLGESIPVRRTEIDDYEFKLKYIDCM